MRSGGDVHATKRQELLEPVAQMCVQAGIEVTIGEYASTRVPEVTALLCMAEEWTAMITPVRASRNGEEEAAHSQLFTRDPRVGYDLDSPGEVVYEVQITESDDGGSGQAPRVLAVFDLVESPRAAADELILWATRSALFRSTPPVPDLASQTERERRGFEHREARAAQPSVRMVNVPSELADDAAAIDHASLSWHFPRDRTARFQRAIVVALAPARGVRPSSRGQWLTVRADGGDLVVSTDPLVGANQRHRWDLTPWLWDGRCSATPQESRWQVERPADVATVARLVREGAIPEALELAGVRVDRDIANLLAGRPTRTFRASQTAAWVANLYHGLADAAPWRLAHAYRVWRSERATLGLPATQAIALFGLGGLQQSRKPQVALDMADEVPLLRLTYSGSNALLSRALWTMPPDLSAHLHGWPTRP
jgi:hypothetical protein